MIIKVKVKSGSRQQTIKKISEENYKINLKERAEDNKANLELLKLLKKEFGKQPRILKGRTSKNKIIKLGN